MNIYLAGRVVRLPGPVFYLGLMLFFLLCLALWICVLYRQSQAEVAVSEFGRCKFYRVADGSKAFDLKLSKEECHRVGYLGDSVIFMRVSYPDMEVLDRNKKNNGPFVSFWFANMQSLPASQEFNSQGLPLISIHNGIYEYRNSREKLWRIIRPTGENVSVYPLTRRIAASWWQGEISVKYQYDPDVASMTEMDDFAARFYKKSEVQGDINVNYKNER